VDAMKLRGAEKYGNDVEKSLDADAFIAVSSYFASLHAG